MSLKLRLITMNFFQFFVWGAWMITIGNYWFGTKHWASEDFGIIFSTMGISSIFMPALCGMIADRWINSERLYGILHILYGITFISLPAVDDPVTFFWVILLGMIFYMPSLALSYSIAYSSLNKANLDTVKHFPPIRVWGTVGFIAAMWLTNLTGNKASENQFYIAGVSAILLGLYAFSLPAAPPQNTAGKGRTLAQILGLEAFKLFKDRKMALFFLFSIFLGAALQLTNAYGDVFLDDFKYAYPDSFVVRYSTIILSISQVSEIVFILAIPFFLKRFGIKAVILTSMLAWVFRFGLFAFSDPEGRTVDDYPLVYRIRYGIRFLQHIRLAVRRQIHQPENTLVGTGFVYNDGQRIRRGIRQLDERHYHRKVLHRGRRHERLAVHLAVFCRLRNGPGHTFRHILQTQ